MSDTQASILQISTSKGGVPKRGVFTAVVGVNGIEGDRQRDRRFHGGPTRALCLYSIEQIAALQADGHTIFPGSTGENITTSGIDLSQVTPGDRLTLGDTVVIEIMSYTSPCRNIKESFRDEEFSRISQKVHPGWSRLYAAVITEGEIAVGDTISLLPKSQS